MKTRLAHFTAGVAIAALAILASYHQAPKRAAGPSDDLAARLERLYVQIEVSPPAPNGSELVRQFLNYIDNELRDVVDASRRKRLLATRIEVVSNAARLLDAREFLQEHEADLRRFLPLANAESQFDGVDAVLASFDLLEGNSGAQAFLRRVTPILDGKAKDYARVRLAELHIVSGSAAEGISILERFIEEGGDEEVLEDARGWLYEAKHLMVGHSVPDTQIATLRGARFSTRGRETPAIIVFVSSECGFSSLAIPRLKTAQARVPDLEILAVCLEQSPEVGRRSEIFRQLEQLRRTRLTIVRRGGALARTFNAIYTPRLLFIDESGVLLWDSLKAKDQDESFQAALAGFELGGSCHRDAGR